MLAWAILRAKGLSLPKTGLELVIALPSVQTSVEIIRDSTRNDTRRAEPVKMIVVSTYLGKILRLAGPGIQHRVYQGCQRDSEKDAEHPPQAAKDQHRSDNGHRVQIIYLGK